MVSQRQEIGATTTPVRKRGQVSFSSLLAFAGEIGDDTSTGAGSGRFFLRAPSGLDHGEVWKT